MMSIGHRKLLFSQINLHRNTRALLVKEIVTCSCYYLCPTKCDNSSENDHSSPPPTSQKNSMPTLLILMLCVLGAAFVFLCYLTILKRYRTNLSSSRRRISSSADGTSEEFVDENHGSRVDHPIWYIHTVGLQQSVIDSIAMFKYKKGEGLIEGTDCSVCLSEFEEDESLRLLPKCSHAFHISCIDTWLRSHKNCPLCRAPIVCDNNIGSTDAPQVNTLQSSLSNSGSMEDTSMDDHQLENDAVGEGRTSELRIGVGNIDPFPNEEGKILEVIKRNASHFIAGKNKVRVLSDLADHQVRIGEETQPVRRSFSMDLPSASMIYAAVAKIHPVKDEGGSNVQDMEVKKQNSEIVAAKQGGKTSSIHRSRHSFSFGRSLQSVPIRMERSFSSSGKFSIPKYSRSQELGQSL